MIYSPDQIRKYLEFELGTLKKDFEINSRRVAMESGDDSIRYITTEMEYITSVNKVLSWAVIQILSNDERVIKGARFPNNQNEVESNG